MTGPQLTHRQKTRRLVYAAGICLIVLLLITGAVLWNDARRATPAPEPVTDVKQIRIQRPDFSDMVLQMASDGQWRITDPCALPVNAQRLQPLLDALTPAVQSHAAADVDLAAAGLLDPQAVIFMNEQKLTLGITDLSGERRYLQRDGRVEFVPEWVLSLVNGGLSALASLDVFPWTLDELVLQTAQSAAESSSSLPPDKLAIWQALAAQQIVTWPLPDKEPETDSRLLLARTNDQEMRLTLQVYPQFAALHHAEAACAYLIPIASLPDISLP